MWKQHTIKQKSDGRGLYDLTSAVAEVVAQSGIQRGLCHCFCQHTSASLIINENYDPDVRVDFETYLSGIVQDGDKRFKHVLEGPDDMAAHIRNVLTATEVSVPIMSGKIGLGTWQAIYLWEHRIQGHLRSIVVTCFGE